MADPVGISLALDDPPLEPNPTWTRLDDAHPNLIAGYTITRGRQDQFDRTSTGVASIRANDVDGTIDPVGGGPYVSLLDGKQAAIALWDPVAEVWSTLFRGFVDDWQYDVDKSQKVTWVTIPLVDGLEYLANARVRPGEDGGTTAGTSDGSVPTGTEGDVFYAETTGIGSGEVSVRINQVLSELGWSTDLREVFTGNVTLQDATYSRDTSALTVINECADAEFPGIANRWIAKDGTFTFHGRLARFNPTDPDYHIATWKVGDGVVASADNTYAQMRGLSYSRPRSRIYNSVMFTPYGVADADIPALLREDNDSIAAYGRRAWGGENLRTLHGNLTGNNNIDECFIFADYYVTVFSQPQTRVTQIVLRSLQPDDPRAAATWALICGVDISDRIQLKCSTPGGGVFDDVLHFVEGIRYEILPANSEYHNVTCTLDVTPATDYDYLWT